MNSEDKVSKPVGKRPAIISLVLVASVILALVGVISFLNKKTEGDALPELSRDDLEHDGTVLRIREDGSVFTGYLISHYPDGAPRARSRIVDGRLHGISEGWYPDGTAEVREEFREGVSHGIRTRWHANGEMASRSEIVEGRQHGVFRLWRDDGTLFQVISMQNDLPHGVTTAYFPSGYLQARATVDQGRVVRQESWEDGDMSEEESNRTAVLR